MADIDQLTRLQKLKELSELADWLEGRPDPRGAKIVRWAYEEVVHG